MSDPAHTGLGNSSVGGIVNAGSMQAASEIEVVEIANINGVLKQIKKKQKVAGFNPQLVAAAKRQSMIRDITPQAKFLETSSYLAMVSSFNSDKPLSAFNNMKEADWENGDLGPYGIYSALVLNTFLDKLEILSGAGLKDPDLFRRAEHQGLDLMQKMQMSPEDINDYMMRHDIDSAA